MTLKYLGLEESEWRKLLDLPVDKLLEAQNGGPQQARGGGPLGMNGGRNGMGGGSRPGGCGPV